LNSSVTRRRNTGAKKRKKNQIKTKAIAAEWTSRGNMDTRVLPHSDEAGAPILRRCFNLLFPNVVDVAGRYQTLGRNVKNRREIKEIST
jgi:hypothetical protein